MKILTQTIDKYAITLSALCIVHCLALPVLMVLLPSLAVLPLQQEAFHIAMVVCVIPTSIYALTMGCRKHKSTSIVYIGAVGLSVLVAAVILGESNLSEVGEKLLTTVGALIIAFAHVRNYKLCQKADDCSC